MNNSSKVTPFSSGYFSMVQEEAQKLVDALDPRDRAASFVLVERILDAPASLPIKPGLNVGFRLLFEGDRVSIEPGLGTTPEGDMTVTLPWAEVLNMYRVTDREELARHMESAVAQGRVVLSGSFDGMGISVAELHDAVVARVVVQDM